MSVHRGVPGPGGRGAWSRGVWSRGVPGLVGSGPRGVPGGDPPMATAAGGMHPTGMYSCLAIFLARTYE